MLIFVYGTLKRGFCRHDALKGQMFLGERTTVPHYRMFNVGTYPGLVDSADDGVSIRGELWEVDDQCLKLLDEVEGVDERQYERRIVQLQSLERQSVQAYFYLPDVAGFPDCGEEWR